MIYVPTATWAHTVFDVLAWGGGLAVGIGVYRWRLRDRATEIAGRTGPGYFIALVGGAVVGGWLSGSLNTLRSAVPSLSHSVVGALAGAIIGVEFYKLVRGIRGSTGVLFVGSFSTGIVVGRLGCLFSGLPDQTYGSPTHLPWAVDLGDGVGRHPVEIYESLAMLVFLGVFVLGLRARRPWALRRGFYALCVWYGVQRFAWEFLKPYPPLVGPFNVFHLLCGGLVAYGLVYWQRDLRDERRAEGGALSVPRPDYEPV